MSRCANNELFKKIGQKLMDDMSEFEVILYRDLPNCKVVNAGKYIALNPANASVYFDKYSVPDNLFECNPMACVNSGTVELNANSVAVTYKAQINALEIVAGIMTFYVKGNGTAGTVTVDLSNDSTFANKNTYVASYPATNDHVPIMIDINNPVEGEPVEWNPSANGVYVRFTFDASSNGVGLSTISFYESYEDFETVEVVKIGCLTDISGTIDIPAITRQCSSATYDTSNLAFTRTVNGKLLTPNFHKLNPMFGKGVEQDGSMTITVRQSVEQDGTVTISDINLEDCSDISVQRTDACEADLAMLSRVYSPILIPNVDEGHFQTIYDVDNQVGVFHFSPRLAGKEVLISYPKKVAVERYSANVNNVGDVRAMARFHGQYQDNKTSMDVVYTLPNILITSFPWNLTRTEQDFSFTFSIQPDANGDYYWMDKIIL